MHSFDPHFTRLIKQHLLCILLPLLICAACEAAEGLKLPSVLTSNMVIQQQLPVRIWGWASPGDEIAVDFAGQHKIAKVDEKGEWKLELDPMPASTEPRTLKVTSKNEAKNLELKNVLVGEVWVCAGQSNMAFAMQAYKTISPNDFTEAFSNIRFYRVPMLGAYYPKADVGVSEWKGCELDQLEYMSATAFYFARDLYRHLNVPIGIVISSIGGTPIESWVPRAAFETDVTSKNVLDLWDKQLTDAYPDAQENYEEYHQKWIKSTQDYYQQLYLPWQKEEEAAKAEGRTPPPKPTDPNAPPFWYRSPTTLYNAMIAPFTSLTIRGVAWYQGEDGSISGNLDVYGKLLTSMIPAWREAWKLGDFPFLMVQLPYITPAASDPNAVADWGKIREFQRQASLNNPNTVAVVTFDTGDDTDLHPLNKGPVGKRLALAARAKAYGEEIIYTGPVVKSAKLNGDKVEVAFAEVGSGLVSKKEDGNFSDLAEVKGFALAGADGKFFWADAKIVGDTVLLQSADVPKPERVRYGWANHPICTLYNREELPAGPFEVKIAPEG